MSASAQKQRRDRERERDDLKSLNSRLQHVIVLQREKDAVLVHEAEHVREEREQLAERLRREVERHRGDAERLGAGNECCSHQRCDSINSRPALSHHSSLITNYSLPPT
jgi:hypothetical protein